MRKRKIKSNAKPQYLSSEKGVILIVVFLFIIVSFTLLAGLMKWTHNEARLTKKHADSLKAFYIADAGLKQALWRTKQDPYSIDTSTLEEDLGDGRYAVSFSTSGTEITITSTGTANGETRRLSAVIDLRSFLAEYVVMAASPSGNWTSGANGQYGENDPAFPAPLEGVSLDPANRMKMYVRGNYIAQPGVDIYGDLYVEGNTTLAATAQIHGDLYAGGGTPASGVNDGYTAADGDSVGDIADDIHSYSSTIEYPSLNLTYYSDTDNNDLSLSGTVYLKFVENVGGYTDVERYNDSNYTTLITTTSLPVEGGLIYVDGTANVKGTIKGKVTVVTSDDINFRGDIIYSNGTYLSDSDNAAAWLAYDDLIFDAPAGVDHTVTGIFYTDEGQFKGSSGSHDALTIYGNRSMANQSNMGSYSPRTYIYDSNINDNPPPNLPVSPIVTRWSDLGR